MNDDWDMFFIVVCWNFNVCIEIVSVNLSISILILHRYTGGFMNVPELDLVINAMLQKGYVVYDTPDKGWNINIVGIRSASNSSKLFDDLLFVFYRLDNLWSHSVYSITTDPSPFYLENPSPSVSKKGTAILKEGQYISAYEINWHHYGEKSQHMALCQLGPVTVYRDNNHDALMNPLPGYEESGQFYINIHRGPVDGDADTYTDTNNSGYSAGCQVFSNYNDFNQFLGICYKSRANFGNVFTYTLLHQNDLD